MAKQKVAIVNQSPKTKETAAKDKKKIIQKGRLREVAFLTARKNGNAKFQSSPHKQDKIRNSQVRLSISNVITQLVDKEQIYCPICLEVIIRPFNTSCGHIFCFSCGQKAILAFQSCSICRKPAELPSLPSQKSINTTIIKSHVYLLEENERKNYESREQNFEEIERNRGIGRTVKVGDFVDFRLLDNVWKVGRVIRSTPEQITLSLNEQQIFRYKIDSRDVARLYTFTSRPQVPPPQPIVQVVRPPQIIQPLRVAPQPIPVIIEPIRVQSTPINPSPARRWWDCDLRPEPANSSHIPIQINWFSLQDRPPVQLNTSFWTNFDYE